MQRVRKQFRHYAEPNHTNIHNQLDIAKEEQEQPLSVEKFLSRIPECKIVGGKVINIRQQVQKDLGIVTATDLGKTLLLEMKDDEEAEAESKATIRIKINAKGSPQNGRNIVLKASFSTTI